jgi:gamma-glutamylcyclotransferase
MTVNTSNSTQPCLYFAYGSNMKTNRLKERVGKVACLGKRVLSDFELCFNKKGNDGSGKANIMKKQNSFVEGVLFKLTAKQMKKLDTFEGVAIKHMKREKVTVQNQRGQSQEVLAYVACKNYRRLKLKPTEEYLGFILDGAKEHKLLKKTVSHIIQKAFS